MSRDRLETPGVTRRLRSGVAADRDASNQGKTNQLDRWLARRLAEALAGASMTVVLWDGSEYGKTPGEAFRIRLADRAALIKLVSYPEVNFGDLYSVGRIEVEGGLVGAVQGAYRALAGRRRLRSWADKTGRVLWARPNRTQSRRNIHHHYDIGNPFYELWLDRDALQYTCAYYPQRDFTLEQAQAAKMDHVCRKLWLKAGDSVVEAGCGWGGFAIFMARQYGARVRAFNISSEQIAHARAWAEREGVADRVEFVEDDYRNISGQYDVFVSIGMLEHVGPGNYRGLGKLIDDSLKPDGRGLIHSIGRDRPAPLNRWIRRRIFPGAYPPTLREMTDIFEPSGLSVLDVENLRLHYEATVLDWLDRFERNADRVEAMFDETFVRAWRLYLAGSAAAFSTGTLQLFQVLFARTGCNQIPRSRGHVYEHDPLEAAPPRIRSAG